MEVREVKIARGLAAVLLGLAFVGNAASAATIYTDRSAWLAAVSGVTTTDFEENATGQTTFYGSTFNGAGFTISGGDSGRIFTVDPDYFPPGYQWNSGDVLDVEFTPSATITAGPDFGFDFGVPSFYGVGEVTIDGTNYPLIGQPVFNFFGVVGGSGSVTVSWNALQVIIDNFSVGRRVAVPEPASLALLGLGLAGLGLSRRRKS